MSMQMAGAGFGVDFNAAVTQPVKLRGKGVLIDDDFADVLFGGNLSAGEAVNINLAAIGAGRWACQGLQFGGELIRIVGERVEVRALDDYRAGIRRR